MMKNKKKGEEKENRRNIEENIICEKISTSGPKIEPGCHEGLQHAGRHREAHQGGLQCFGPYRRWGIGQLWHPGFSV